MPKEYCLLGQDYKFRPTGGPIDSPENNADLFRALGLAQAAWSRMEHMVTALAIHINKEEASDELHDPDPADAFRRKLKLVEDWITKHPPYAHIITAKHERFFMRLKELAVKRNEIIHGHLRGFDPQSKKLQVGNIQRTGKDVWRVRVMEYPLSTLEGIADLSNIANKEFERIADAIFPKEDDAASPQTP